MRIGIDIGGSHIGAGLIDESGKIASKIDIDINKDSIEDIKQFISENILQIISKMMQNNNIELIGIGSPGIVQNGCIKSLVNLGIDNFNIFKLINDNFNIPVVIKNDAKCAAIAEKKYGGLKEYENSVFLCLGTGIGGEVFINGKPVEYKNNSGFEIGHMIIQKENGIRCNCGSIGCFETYCSIKRFKENIINALSLPKETIGEELIDILKDKKDNKNVKKIIDLYIQDLIVGISNIINIFEPQCICLGGSFVAFKDILYKELLIKINEKNFIFNKCSMPKIKLATLGNDAGIIGATI